MRSKDSLKLHEKEKFDDFLLFLKGVVKDFSCKQGNVSRFLRELHHDGMKVYEIYTGKYDLNEVESIPFPVCIMEFYITDKDTVEVSYNTNYKYFTVQNFDFTMMKKFSRQFDNAIITFRFDDSKSEVANRIRNVVKYYRSSVDDKDVTTFAYETNVIIKELELRFQIDMSLKENDQESFLKYSKEYKKLLEEYAM